MNPIRPYVARLCRTARYGASRPFNGYFASRAMSTARPLQSTPQKREKNTPTIAEVIRQDAEAYQSENIKDMLSLQKKVTLITGAGRGIGLAMARGAAELGSDLAILDILESPHESLWEIEKEFGVRVKYYRTDVTQLDQLTESFDRVQQDLGGIDNCIATAGVVVDKPFLDHTWDESARILSINVMGSLFTAQLAAKAMQKHNRGGSIVLIASGAAYNPIPARCMAVYSASKGAIRTATKSLAMELAPLGIRVNLISPGFIATEMIFDEASKNPTLWSVVNNTPVMGRLGQRADLKGVIAYLLRDASRFATGTDMIVDGGLHLGSA